MHIHRDHGMADEFKNDARVLNSQLKQIFEKGDFAAEACRAYTSASSAKCSPEALAASGWASASPALWV
jgi:hypothetical protein